ncbi:hypothetical protein N7447_009592 [Penicillium robsamsonii]|uniref:uncharacterized protein n=1 Tax=Penicillium robsamsonii TaxID=1792511 RepID=UPI0025480D36|nr:uncharacterized protein N7447_009592 [Penicillium robsamsonii]KAJ5817359.1 hypothetical protein N7447_009592 [Penicillium robsamsonii]
MQTRSQTRSQTQDQPPQPPKQAAYAQSSNPVSHTPQEQRATEDRHHGDTIGTIKRTASSQPSSDEARARLSAQHQQHEHEPNASDVDLEYGVEQQPAEGYIADTVQRKGMGIQRAQPGAHAGPVGSSGGPGHPGFGEADDLAANLGAKRVEHDRILGDRVGKSPVEPEGEAAEREGVRRRMLEKEERLDVEGAVKQATGDPVVGK